MDQGLIVNTLWVLICTALVFLMQAGFCCLESGLSRSKNSINVAIKNIVDFCIGAFIFWLFGYGLLYGASLWGLFGTDHYLFTDSSSTRWPTTLFLFQMVFCGTATTIASGATAERMRFRAYIVLAITVSGIIYPLFGHWAWAQTSEGNPVGWLARLGFLDFAGSTVVHSVGAWSALAAVILIGPRMGRFEKGKPPREFTGSNLPVATLGLFLLWAGWFGFNGGSAMGVSEKLPTIILNTMLAGSVGGLSILLWHLKFSKIVSVPHVINGILAGLVGITASCNVVSPAAAMVIGIVAAVIMLAATFLLEDIFHLDDVVGAIAVHGFAGVWGTLAVALFAPSTAFGPGINRWLQLGVQALGVGICFLWSFGVTYGVLKLASRRMTLRVTAHEEKLGLNVAEHGATIELYDLLTTMQENSEGNLTARASADEYTEAGIIAHQYNRVLDANAKARSDLQEREVRYRGIFENMTTAVVTIDERGFVEEFNAAAETMFDYSCNEVVGKNARMLMPDNFNGRNGTPFKWNRATSGLQEITGKRREGGTFPLEIIISQHVIPDGDENRARNIFTALLTDLTHRKQAEEELVNARKAAEAASKAKSEFLTNMSHELRTPMAAILGYSDILIESERDTENKATATTIKKQGEHMLDMVDAMLCFNEALSATLEVEKTGCSPQSIVQDVVDVLQEKANEKGLQIEIQTEGEIPDLIYTDPQRLHQVLLNVIGNGIKFTETGTIQIITRLLQEPEGEMQIQFEVIDSGIGIPSNKLETLFNPFSQADNSASRQFGGLGMGLAISKQLVHLLGGEIAITSKEGTGTTASLSLPLRLKEEAQPASADLRETQTSSSDGDAVESTPDISAEPAEASLSGCRILLAEDGHANQRLFSFILKKVGAEITTAENGQIALDLALSASKEGQPFEMIIMDMQMPVLDGYAATGRLREEGFDIPIIALTAHSLPEDRQKCLDCGCDDYLTKPIDRELLLETLAGYAGQSLAIEASDKSEAEEELETEAKIETSVETAVEAAQDKSALDRSEGETEETGEVEEDSGEGEEGTEETEEHVDIYSAFRL